MLQLTKTPSIFGFPQPQYLDRNAKARIAEATRAFTTRQSNAAQRTPISRAAYLIMRELLYRFHSKKTGLCFPSYDTLAEAAGCCRTTVARAIVMLRQGGLLKWVHRISRIKVPKQDEDGSARLQTKLVRTSNGYEFMDPKAHRGRNPYPQATKSQTKPRPPEQNLNTLPKERERDRNIAEEQSRWMTERFARALTARRLPET